MLKKFDLRDDEELKPGIIQILEQIENELELFLNYNSNEMIFLSPNDKKMNKFSIFVTNKEVNDFVFKIFAKTLRE